MNRQIIFWLLLPLLLTACSSFQRQPRQAAEVEDRAVVTEANTETNQTQTETNNDTGLDQTASGSDETANGLPGDREIIIEPMADKPEMSSVASRLLSKSETQRDAGDWDGAANSLERALRIEPKNALLWSRLADIRYAQHQWQPAIQLAAKSNTLLKDNQNLRRQNWYLMFNAYRELGDNERADKYRQKLNQP